MQKNSASESILSIPGKERKVNGHNIDIVSVNYFHGGEIQVASATAWNIEEAAAFWLSAACPQARAGKVPTRQRSLAGRRARAEAQATPTTLGLARAVVRKAKGERLRQGLLR